MILPDHSYKQIKVCNTLATLVWMVPAFMGFVSFVGCGHFSGVGCHIPGAAVTPSCESVDAANLSSQQMSCGRFFEECGQPKEAALAYQLAQRHDPLWSEPYLRLAILHDRQRHFAESKRFFLKALERSPANPDIFCCVGYSHYIQGRWREAEVALRQAIALDPTHQRSHNNLGLVLASMNRLDDALVEFQKVGSSDAHARTNLAAALNLQGRLSLAQENYQIALAYDPISLAARRDLQRINAVMAELRIPISNDSVTFHKPKQHIPPTNSVIAARHVQSNAGACKECPAKSAHRETPAIAPESGRWVPRSNASRSQSKMAATAKNGIDGLSAHAEPTASLEDSH